MFQPPPSTLERLQVILRALDRYGGETTTRNLDRLCGVKWWEIDQAVETGFIEVETRKPKIGRPSQVVRKVSKSKPTKLPPRRSSLEKRVTRKQWDFAFWYVIGECGPGLFSFKRRAWKAYEKVYRSCQSDGAARASASRLMKKPEVPAAIWWQFAKLDRDPDLSNEHPQTATEIWETLYRRGSYRAERAPWWMKWRWEQREKAAESSS